MKLSDLEIVYEDNHFLAVNKPAGLLTQPTDNETLSLEILAKEWIKDKYGKPGNVFLGVIHRLDRSVSGIVLFAKTSKALSRMNDAMRSKEIIKVYHARVEGSPPHSNGILEHYLRHDDWHAEVCESSTPGAKLARLVYTVIERLETTSVLEIKLETGRYHQIRAQCAAIGCPIVGDKKYGSKMPMPQGTIALKHVHMQFKHPITKELCDIKL